MSNKLGRLASDVGNKMTSKTGFFKIHKNKFPEGRKEAYANVVCNYRPLKDNPYRVRPTVGVDRLIYPGDTSAPAAYLTDSKIIFNSTISTPGA